MDTLYWIVIKWFLQFNYEAHGPKSDKKKEVYVSPSEEKPTHKDFAASLNEPAEKALEDS